MNFVIPMAGRGSRFQEAGYDIPKWKIEVHGKSLFEWSISSLPLEVASRVIIVMLEEHDIDFAASDFVNEVIGDAVEVKIVRLPEVTRGQAETVYAAKDFFLKTEGLLIFNIDTYVRSETLFHNLQRADVDGIIGSFKDDHPGFSYAELDHAGFVSRTAEKEVLSEHALNGIYHFSKTADFLDVATNHIANKITHRGEFYIAPMYNDLIALGKRFILDQCIETWPLGTPEEVKRFAEDFKSE